MNPVAIDNMSWAMAEVYGSVTDRILINLAKYFPYINRGKQALQDFEYQAKMLAQMGQVNKETIAIITQSLSGADDALKATLEAAIINALRDEEPKLRKAAENGLLTKGVPELSPNQMQAFRAYYNQSADKLNLVNTVMLESTQNAYAATVSDVVQKVKRTQSIMNTAAGEVVTGVSSWNQALHGAVQKMVQNGLTGFIDRAGHKWSPEAYVAMDIRTTMFNTSRAAIWERSQQYGNDLYQVSSHQGARPLCYPWQGKVISTTGRTGTTEDLDGNTVVIHSESEIESFRYGGGLFGVNCGHYPMVFIPGVSTLKGEPQDPEENAKTYAESQQQRALERKLREEKRDLEVMKAQGASPQEIAAQKERVKKADSDIEQFCQDTGRTRKRSRESAPVRAEWPDGVGVSVTRYNNGYIGTNETPPPKGQIRAIPEPISVRNEPMQNVAPQATQTPQNVIQLQKQNTAFTPATTIQEAEQYADKFAYFVQYNGKMTVDAANAVNKELTMLTDVYPIDKFARITQNGRIGAIAQANFREIEINAKKLVNPTVTNYAERQAEAKAALSKISQMPTAMQIKNQRVKDICEAVLKCTRYDVEDPDNIIGSTIAHEYGHVIADQYFGQINGVHAYKNAGSQACADARKKVRDAYKQAMTSGDAYKISEYATRDEYEFLAETFTAQWIGEALPQYITDMLGEVFGHGKL